MNPRMIRLFIAGFLSTVIITVMMFIISPFMSGGLLDTAAMVNGVLVGSSFAGVLAHFLVGMLVLPALYSLFLEHARSIGPSHRGIAWGLVLWVVTEGIVVPMMGGGFFSTRAGGVISVVDLLVGHLAYGVVFGFLAGGAHQAASRKTRPINLTVRVRRAV